MAGDGTADADADAALPVGAAGCLMCVKCAVRFARVDVGGVCRQATPIWVLAEVTSLRSTGTLAPPPSSNTPSDRYAVWTLRAISSP